MLIHLVRRTMGCESWLIVLSSLVISIGPILYYPIYQHEAIFKREPAQKPQEFFTSLWNTVSNILPTSFLKESAPQKPQPFFTSLWNTISNILSTSFLKEPAPKKPQEFFTSLWNTLSNILPPSFLQESAPQKPQPFFTSLWNTISNILSTSFLKEPAPKKPQEFFTSLWNTLSNILPPSFLQSLKAATSFSKEPRTSSFEFLGIYNKDDILNFLLGSSIILAVSTWMLKSLIEILLAWKKVREDKSHCPRNRNHLSLMNLAQRLQASYDNKWSFKPFHCSCRHGNLHKPQGNGTQSHTANTPSLGQSQLQHPSPRNTQFDENNLMKGYCLQSNKSSNQHVSPISPHVSVKHFQQGITPAMMQKENENFQFKMKELLHNPQCEFNRLVELANAVSPIMVYHVTNKSCGTGMKKGILPRSEHKGAVTTIQASQKENVVQNEFQKQYQSAITIQSNFRGFRTRNHLKRWSNEMETIAFRSNDDLLHPKVEIPPIIVLDEPHYPSKVENQINSSTLSSQSNQVCYSRASSQSSRASQEGDQELALEFQHRAQLGILIRPRMDHHGVIESRDSTSKTTKESSSSYNDLVNKIWIKNNSLQIPTKPEAVVTIQASYRGHLARKDLKKQHQSATILQSNFRGYRSRNCLKRWSNEMETIAFESSDYNLLNKLHHPSKVEKQINSSSLSAQSYQVCDNRPSSCSSCASPESDRDSTLAYQHRVQLGIVIRPRLGDDGGSESRGLTSKTTKGSSSSYNDLVCCYGVDVIGKKNTLLEDLTKEEAVVTVQAGYRGHLARKNLKRQHQCATTIQANFRGYRLRKELDQSPNERITFCYKDDNLDSKAKVVAFHLQDEPDDIIKKQVKVASSKATSRHESEEFQKRTARAAVQSSQVKPDLPSCSTHDAGAKSAQSCLCCNMCRIRRLRFEFPE